MAKDKIEKVSKPKATNLDKFSLSFEYNVSWDDARKLVRERTYIK